MKAIVLAETSDFFILSSPSTLCDKCQVDVASFPLFNHSLLIFTFVFFYKVFSELFFSFFLHPYSILYQRQCAYFFLLF
jgi:hypothetical protein